MASRGRSTLIKGIRPNPSQCLVYDVDGGRRRNVTRSTLKQQIDLERSNKNREKRAHDIRVCGDGDSWINILYPFSKPFGYDPTFFDKIEESSGFYATNTGYPGDTFEEMRLEKDYRQSVKSGSFHFFIFSGGGNDVLGGGALRELLKWRDEVSSAKPADFIHAGLLDMTLEVLRSGYTEIAADVHSLSPKTRMLVHSYGYGLPRKDGVWMGRPMAEKGYDVVKEKVLVRGIIRYLVDAFHDMLSSVPHTTLVDVRQIPGTRWKDEIHPTGAASSDIAAKFKSVMRPVA